jgi:hypothetical protein
MKRNERSKIGEAVQVKMAKQENKIEVTFSTDIIMRYSEQCIQDGS